MQRSIFFPTNGSHTKRRRAGPSLSPGFLWMHFRWPQRDKTTLSNPLQLVMQHRRTWTALTSVPLLCFCLSCHVVFVGDFSVTELTRISRRSSQNSEFFASPAIEKCFNKPSGENDLFLTADVFKSGANSNINIRQLKAAVSLIS